MAHQSNPEQVAVNLFTNAEFRTLQLGTWLRTPEGKLVTAAVEALAPPLYREDIELLVEAISLAAKMQQKDSRSRAAAAAIVIAVGGAILATASSG
jgi:hypothetical protein